ncbi:MAG TPA: GDSL-type esterase/lipase family protein [Opitutaceae bacterium]|nr:GDSL-type esterase/lipase family protein [Opitutaceae bacterium]
MRSLTVLVFAALVCTGAPAALAQVQPAAAARDPRFELPATDDGLAGEGPIRRYDWFRNLWRARRAQWASEAGKDRGAVVFLGDSITQGWEHRLAQHFPGLKSANRGISGDTTRGLLLRLDEDVLALKPAGVVLLIGTNDLEEQAQPWIVASNIRLLLARLKAHNPTMPVVINQVMPSSDTKKRPNYKIKRLNFLIRELVKDQPQVTLVDTWTLFATPQGDANPAEFPDLLHLNDAAYAKWAAALRPVLETLGLLPVPADDFQPEPGFLSLFNGRDLSGWGFHATTEEELAGAKRWQAGELEAAEWTVVKEPVAFDGQAASPDGRFVARNGRLIVTTPPENRRIQKLWTTRTFPQNFVLKLEFRPTPNADSGVYLRGPQLQCRDYLLAGPYKQLKNFRPLDWNELVVTVRDGVAHATCNGEVLEAALSVPADGPIGVEGDRGQMEYRRIRVQEL